jgi:dihydroorotate dehydrogenase
MKKARDCGMQKPVTACGGIFSVDAVVKAKEAGFSAVRIGTVAMHRPWRTRKIIQTTHELFQ